MSKNKRDIKEKGTTFKSDVKIYDSMEVLTTDTLLSTCQMIQKAHVGKEFSILCKGKLEEEGFVVDDEIAIPAQEVTGADVDFTDTEELEKYRTEGFNVIIHSHPFKSSNFSHSDLSTLSVNYDCSILFSGDEFPIATLRLPFGKELENILVIDAKVERLRKYFPKVVETSKEKIKSKSYVQDYNKGFGCNRDFLSGEKTCAGGVGETRRSNVMSGYGTKFILPSLIDLSKQITGGNS